MVTFFSPLDAHMARKWSDELIVALKGPPGEGLQEVIEGTYTPDFMGFVPFSLAQIETFMKN